MKVFLVAGARPNFMKIAPIVRALRARNEVEKVGSCESNTNQINYKIIKSPYSRLIGIMQAARGALGQGL